MKKKISIKLKNNPYDIIISRSFDDLAARLNCISETKKIFVITDGNIAKIYLPFMRNFLTKRGFNLSCAVIKPGEEGKSLKSLNGLYDKAVSFGIDRKSVVVAFGGGVVGDCAGFFAATYMRGIKFVQVPTTLLAMTDSSVGGKTGVNTAFAKNIVGAFYQPSFVWINAGFIETLPVRQIRNGMAEIVKYAFTFSVKFYDYLSDKFQNSRFDITDFEEIIYKSCLFKAQIVLKDEKETKGLREVLNFGHTLAHAVETATGYKKYLHGEAVAIGMLFAARLSADIYKNEKIYDKVKELLSAAGLLFKMPAISSQKLISLMKRDKKSVSGKIKFVLIPKIGKFKTGVEVDEKTIITALHKK